MADDDVVKRETVDDFISSSGRRPTLLSAFRMYARGQGWERNTRAEWTRLFEEFVKQPA